ncbi:MAG TPA: hypothetical protein VF624_06560 [Tepidisphaeraceae bacterium]|jgi:hypothetical protein
MEATTRLILTFACAGVLAASARAQSTQQADAPTTNGSAIVVPADAPMPDDERLTLDLAPPRPLGFTGAAAIGTQKGQDDFLAIPDRWRIGLPPGYLEDVRASTGDLTNPYRQNVLKGDYPIVGQDKFLVVTLTSDTLVEGRKLPVPSGTSTLGPDSLDFFGRGDQIIFNQNFVLAIEYFQGDAAFKPRDFEIRLTQVYNFNYAQVEELGGTNVDVRKGRSRLDNAYAWQEAFFEKHLGDLSNDYDFYAVRAGIQGFNADFRGFLYNDNNAGVRFFGNLDGNRYQYNLAWFHQLDKDTNSGLNTFTFRDQDVFIANLYRQDFLGFMGYTAQVSLAANIDRGDIEFDSNDVLVRPQPIGVINEKNVEAYYVGWAGDGKFGRFNVTHQFYQAFGREENSAFAAEDTSINAQFFAIELSYDQDWRRYRASFLYQSGDSDPEDGQATGFDGIFDNPNFAGGGFNYFTRQAIRLTGAGVNLTSRNSTYANLRTSKEQGQANFVNPGLLLYNIGFDAEITPRLKWINNLSYLQFADPEVLQLVLNDDNIERDIGIDISTGVIYRPLLNNNLIVNAGVSVLVPGSGFQALYTADTLYSAFISMTLTY